MTQAQALARKIGQRGDFYSVVVNEYRKTGYPVEHSYGVDFGAYHFKDGSVLLFTEGASGRVYFQHADTKDDLPNVVGPLSERAAKDTPPTTQAQRAFHRHTAGGMSEAEVEMWEEAGTCEGETERGDRWIEGMRIQVQIEDCEGWVFSLHRAQRDIHVFSDGSSLHRVTFAGAWVSASKEITTITLAKMGLTLADHALII